MYCNGGPGGDVEIRTCEDVSTETCCLSASAEEGRSLSSPRLPLSYVTASYNNGSSSRSAAASLKPCRTLEGHICPKLLFKWAPSPSVRPPSPAD